MNSSQEKECKATLKKYVKRGFKGVSEEALLQWAFQSWSPLKSNDTIEKELLKKFKSIKKLLSTSEAEITNLFSLQDEELSILKILRSTSNKTNYTRKRTLTLNNLLIYERESVRNPCENELRLLYVDRGLRLISDELIQYKTVNINNICVREEIKHVLYSNAQGLIILQRKRVENLTPSEDDIKMTNQFRDALHALNLQLHDHVITGIGSHFSFREEGHL